MFIEEYDEFGGYINSEEKWGRWSPKKPIGGTYVSLSNPLICDPIIKKLHIMHYQNVVAEVDFKFDSEHKSKLDYTITSYSDKRVSVSGTIVTTPSLDLRRVVLIGLQLCSHMLYKPKRLLKVIDRFAMHL